MPGAGQRLREREPRRRTADRRIVDERLREQRHGGLAVALVERDQPRVLRTREEIKGWLEDMYGRDMTHSVKHRVLDETGAAYSQACRYPDGTNVLCATVIELDGGVIAGQTVIQVWDEA